MVSHTGQTEGQSSNGLFLLPFLAEQDGSPLVRTYVCVYVQDGSLQQLGLLGFSSNCLWIPVLLIAGT